MVNKFQFFGGLWGFEHPAVLRYQKTVFLAGAMARRGAARRHSCLARESEVCASTSYTRFPPLCRAPAPRLRLLKAPLPTPLLPELDRFVGGAEIGY